MDLIADIEIQTACSLTGIFFFTNLKLSSPSSGVGMKLFLWISLMVFSSNALASEISAEGLNELAYYQPLHDCYKKFQQDNKQTGAKSGKLAMDVKLDKRGDVLAISVDSKKSTLYADSLSSCVVQVLKALKFPKEVSGKEKTLSLALDFPLRKHNQK